VHGLQGLTVVEFATEISGPYAGKLFADAGATVIKVETPEGDPLRHRTVSCTPLDGTDSALFRHLNGSKKSMVGEPEDRRVQSLVASADLVIESFVPSRIDIEQWRERFPQLVILSLTPYGRVGPWRDRPATPFTIQAESGSLGNRGLKDKVPFQAGGRITEWCAGVFGAVGALAAVMRAQRTGRGEHVDASLLASDHLATNGNVCVRHTIDGHPAVHEPARVVDVPSIEQTSDGYLGLNTNTRQQFESFLTMIEREDLLDDPRWSSAGFRLLHAEEFTDFIRPWMLAHTTEEALKRAVELRIPAAPVNNGRTVLEQEQFITRQAIGPMPGADFLHPHTINGERPGVGGPAPSLGEHQDLQPEPPTKAGDVDPQSDPDQLPFAGLRVLDATSMWAGPIVGQVLAALGADVIHLESIQRLDLGRLKVDAGSGLPKWWERGPSWFMINFNKRDLTVDLTSEAGRELIDGLIKQCDVLVENFSPRVFEKFGFSAERVMELNPDIVYARMPAFGLDGPWRDHIGFAQTMEQMTGMAWVTGHVDDDVPHVPRGPCDPLAGFHALFAILIALQQRNQGAGGSVVEAAMVESALNAAAELVVEYSAYGAEIGRSGNRSPDAAPQGLYQCRGWEQWLALSVDSDEQWEAVKGVLGSPPWAEAPELKTMAGRRLAHDQIDTELGAWAAERNLQATVESLVSVGVPAGSVTDPRFADFHEQMYLMGYFEEIDHPVLGRHRNPTLPFRYQSVERWVRTPAPELGQHNEEILGGLLGLGDTEIAELQKLNVIGTEPLGSNPSFVL
jgi:crotonobetainyl-CoA:carnitine CoA-transferase CaiB-like acyl-CoA transferase